MKETVSLMRIIENATAVESAKERTDFEHLDFLRMGGETKRYHAWPVIHEQNVAEHSCHVAMLCSWLANMDKVRLRAALLMGALTHDWAEQKLGDLPAPSKRSLPPYEVNGTVVPFRQVWDDLEAKELGAYGMNWEAVLTKEEEQILKVADAADGCLYCIRERALGNKLISEVYYRFRQYLMDISLTYGSGVLEDYIDHKWAEANG